LFIKCGVRAVGVVEFDPFADYPFGHKTVCQVVQINRFLLQGLPEAFNEDVVEVTASTVLG